MSPIKAEFSPVGSNRESEEQHKGGSLMLRWRGPHGRTSEKPLEMTVNPPANSQKEDENLSPANAKY